MDGKSLQAYEHYLRGCHNAMQDLQYLEELDSTSNIRCIVLKLPYKYREKWRFIASDLLENKRCRVKFIDIFVFIDKQATIVTGPLYGDLQDPVITRKPLA